jgi:hypothetical protein
VDSGRINLNIEIYCASEYVIWISKIGLGAEYWDIKMNGFEAISK